MDKKIQLCVPGLHVHAQKRMDGNRPVQHFFDSKIGFAEYWIHFLARSDGVHAFGYNSAES